MAKYGYVNDTIYAAGVKGNLYIFNAKDGKQELCEKKHDGEIFSIEFNKDYSLLASCAKDNYCHVMDPYTFDIIRSFNKQSPCRCASFSPFQDVDGLEKFHLIIGGGQDAKDVTTTD